ncbi:barrier-to-autointegration factor-like [Drosophila pseudoobscura]|uniref:Barrier-to-autointegration factor 1 n=1 Tax=Drosophila pseudoobscura pseudoobscura TaxID=46245 RepID=A0A6I8UY23_DROPS|nr:barrier-to-autointegration factor [Drosophila pseudoobscura]
MSGMSEKFKNFVAESMGDKDATELPGIGSMLAERLTEAGFEKAYHVLGQFLVFGKDEDLFVMWLTESFQASFGQALDCYDCLYRWCDLFL